MAAGSELDIRERLLEDFERAWLRENPPDLPAVVRHWESLSKSETPATGDRDTLAAELIKIDLEYRWRQPRPPEIPGPQLETYLEMFPELRNDRKRLLELIVEEYRVRLHWSDLPETAEYLQRFPEADSELERALQKVRDERVIESSIRDLFRGEKTQPDDELARAPARDRQRFEQTLKFLAETHPFSELPEDLQRRITESAHERQFEEGDYLIRQGAPADSMLVLLDGIAQVTLSEPDGGEREIARVGRHAVLGEIGLLTREVRTANVKALQPVRAVVITLADYQKLVGEFPTLNVLISELISQRVGAIAVDIMYGKTLDHYRFKQRLGRGSMGIVYLADDLQHGREVAVKMLRHNLIYDRQATKRFVREAEVIRTLKHDNIIEVYREFSAYNTRFLSMELCLGASLSEIILKAAPFPYDVIRMIVGQLADALHHAHERGVVHRDLKPANVMLTTDGLVKLTDFGLARTVQSLSLTAAGQLLGTPRYMPSQLISGDEEADYRADVYALGCIVWELIRKTPVFDAKGLVELLQQQITWTLPAPERIAADLPDDLYRVLAQSLSQNPDDRTLDLESLIAWSERLPLVYCVGDAEGIDSCDATIANDTNREQTDQSTRVE